MAVWWEVILEFLLGVLSQIGYLLGVQFLNLSVFWQLLPIYSNWFAIQFITGGTEGIADQFMNGFALLWVGFELGSYIIENFFTDPYIIIKTLIVGVIFAYAVFIMRLTLLKKDISNYLARVGEISAINVAAMLFIQDLLVIKGWMQLIHLIIAFVVTYALFDFGIIKLVHYLYSKLKLPFVEEVVKKEEEAPKPPKPRYERITKPTPPTTSQPRPKPPTQPVRQPPVQQRRVQPQPRQPVRQPPVQQRRVQPQPRQPVRQPPTTPARPKPPKIPTKEEEE